MWSNVNIKYINISLFFFPYTMISFEVVTDGCFYLYPLSDTSSYMKRISHVEFSREYLAESLHVSLSCNSGMLS